MPLLMLVTDRPTTVRRLHLIV